MKVQPFLFVALALLLSNCQSASEPKDAASSPTAADTNPPAQGFNAEGSDPRAIEIADSVMLAMGGRQSWDTTRYFHWNFFGMRTLLWDKQEGRVKITMLPDSTQMVVDLDTGEGEIYSQDKKITDEAALREGLQQAKSIWINDAYWLFMPFKLKDSGVTLEYLKADTTQAGQAADLLQLTFDSVGDTPQNKYHVWVGKEDRLVRQWAYFANATDEEPKFVLPWDNYRTYGDIMLSGDRGERQITDIKVMEEVPRAAFAVN